jgi:hypothetical protein
MLNELGEVQQGLEITTLQSDLDSATVLALESLVIPPELVTLSDVRRNVPLLGKKTTGYFRIADCQIHSLLIPHTDVFNNLVPNVKKGTWSLFCLASFDIG